MTVLTKKHCDGEKEFVEIIQQIVSDILLKGKTFERKRTFPEEALSELFKKCSVDVVDVDGTETKKLCNKKTSDFLKKRLKQYSMRVLEAIHIFSDPNIVDEDALPKKANRKKVYISRIEKSGADKSRRKTDERVGALEAETRELKRKFAESKAKSNDEIRKLRRKLAESDRKVENLEKKFGELQRRADKSYFFQKKDLDSLFCTPSDDSDGNDPDNSDGNSSARRAKELRPLTAEYCGCGWMFEGPDSGAEEVSSLSSDDCDAYEDLELDAEMIAFFKTRAGLSLELNSLGEKEILNLFSRS